MKRRFISLLFVFGLTACVAHRPTGFMTSWPMSPDIKKIYEKLEDTVFPRFTVRDMRIQDVVRKLVDDSTKVAPMGMGCSIILNLSSPSPPLPELSASDGDPFIFDDDNGDPFSFDDAGPDDDLDLTETSQPRITLDLEGANFIEVLNAVCEQADLVWHLSPIPVVMTRQAYQQILDRKRFYPPLIRNPEPPPPLIEGVRTERQREIERELETFIIPDVEWRSVMLSEVVNELNRKGVVVFRLENPESDQAVTLSLRKVSLLDLAVYVAEVTHQTLRFDGETILFSGEPFKDDVFKPLKNTDKR